MAVVNDVDDALSHPTTAGELTGARVLQVTKVISIAADDSATSVYKIADIPGTACIDELTIEQSANSNAPSVVDCGLYDTAGTVIDADALASNMDLSTVTNLIAGPGGGYIRHATTAIAYANANKKVFEHAGHVQKPTLASGETLAKSMYRVALTVDTAGSAAITLVARLRYRMAG